jgi:HEAT repeat protein
MDDGERGPDHRAPVDDHDLVDRALVLVRDLVHSESDDEYWSVVHELNRRGTQAIFDQVAVLVEAEEPAARRLACDVLGQLGYEHGRPFASESFRLLARLCADSDEAVLDSAIFAMGHLGLAEAAPILVAQARNADADVRYSVAWSLPSVLGHEWIDADHPGVAALMALTTDEDARVRDWATFGLGSQLKVDGSGVRACLYDRVDDSHDDTRSEALVGLARRREREVVHLVRAALEADAVGRMAMEAAALLGDGSLADPLEALAEWWDLDPDLLATARRQCDPAAIDCSAALVKSLVDVAALNHLPLAVSSELLPDGPTSEATVRVAGTDGEWGLEHLMHRADGSADAAVRLVEADLLAVGRS